MNNIIGGQMNNLVSEYLSFVPKEHQKYYEEISETAIMLGYKPKRDRTKHFSISFSSAKYKNTILRLINENAPSFRLKFFATNDYSKIFDESIKWIIEKYSYKYVGCYGCGKCKDNKEGYTVAYPDGKKYFRCGFELIEIRNMNEEIKNEVVSLLRKQSKYFEDKYFATNRPTIAST